MLACNREYIVVGAADELSNGTGKDARDYSRAALLTGIGHIAASMRASVTDWRNPHGTNIKEFLKQLCTLTGMPSPETWQQREIIH